MINGNDGTVEHISISCMVQHEDQQLFQQFQNLNAIWFNSLNQLSLADNDI